MDKDVIYTVVCKIIGPIQPVGESNEDDRRFENLKVVTHLVDKLLFDINHVAVNKTRSEYSMKRAGELASRFMRDVWLAKEE